MYLPSSENIFYISAFNIIVNHFDLKKKSIYLILIAVILFPEWFSVEELS